MGGEEAPCKYKPEMLQIPLTPAAITHKLVNKAWRALFIGVMQVIPQPYTIPCATHQGGFHEIMA